MGPDIPTDGGSVAGDERARRHRTAARDDAMRRISIWTTALAVGGVFGSGAVAVVARAAAPGSSAGSSSSSTGADPAGTAGQDDRSGTGTSGGLQPLPQDPQQGQQQAPQQQAPQQGQQQPAPGWQGGPPPVVSSGS
jgi:hypothetical protein